jgi:hypothetical protein
VNDDLIDNALTLGSFVCAAVCGVVTLAFGKSSGLSGSGLVVLCTAGVFIGYVMAMVMLKVCRKVIFRNEVECAAGCELCGGYCVRAIRRGKRGCLLDDEMACA